MYVVCVHSARQTSVAFAAGRKQNAAQKSDRQPEPLPANTPVVRAECGMGEVGVVHVIINCKLY